MFNTYSYTTVPLAGVQRHQTYKKIKLKLKNKQKIDQNEVFTAFTNVLFLFSIVAHVYICFAYFSWMFNEIV